MNNTSDSDPNRPYPSSNQTPRKKRTRISNNETSSSSSRPKPVRKPVKKPDPNAPQITQPCTECGKKFWSDKALHGHMRCHPERQWRGLNPPLNHQQITASQAAEDDQDSKLLMLATAATTASSEVVEGRFECEGCKNVFQSHQALDAHNHVKGCPALTNLAEDPPPPPPQQETVDQDRKGKRVKFVSGIIHRCHICSKEFSNGQALGGHMRCHWRRDQQEKNQASTVIDLNVPASTNVPGSSSDTLSLDLRLGL